MQFPPEYDPYVRYPTIVTLNGAGTTPEHQIDWWAGAQNENGTRLGQATRRGYIVIAVDWMKEGQLQYEFLSPRTRGRAGQPARRLPAVLDRHRPRVSYRALDRRRRRLGHRAGASRPVGRRDSDRGPARWKYCAHYWQNAKLLPFYVVQGELDGDKVKENARDLDRYLINRYDVTVVEYQGRGHEDFYEEIQTLFDWMGHREPRNFFPKEFEVSTMRTWDNYFWWLEANKLPPESIVEPSNWPPKRGTRAAELKGKVLASGDLLVAHRRNSSHRLALAGGRRPQPAARST